MVRDTSGAVLDEHTKKKHTILREYFRQYLITRCQLPQQGKFKLIVVDGFSGAGRYKCGGHGSPLIFVEVLESTLREINGRRVAEGFRPIHIECLLILNDFDRSVVEQLRQNIAPLLARAKDNLSELQIQVDYCSQKFDEVYPQIKNKLKSIKCRNVLFNLDQYGYSKVDTEVIRDITQSWDSAEIFFTFSIDTILAYISSNQKKNSVPLKPEIREKVYAFLESGEPLITKEIWLGDVERIIFENLKNHAPFVSPFSINNPDGWGYWLMHFANSYRARQVYNNILHENSMAQAHFGRSGLNMLSYDPKYKGQLYLFDNNARESAKNELYDDIPRLIAESGDVLGMEDFYRAAYSETPAHSDDIHEMIIKNPDIEVITESGGERRRPNTIKATDVLRLKSQKSMFSMFSRNT